MAKKKTVLQIKQLNQYSLRACARARSHILRKKERAREREERPNDNLSGGNLHQIVQWFEGDESSNHLRQRCLSRPPRPLQPSLLRYRDRRLRRSAAYSAASRSLSELRESSGWCTRAQSHHTNRVTVTPRARSLSFLLSFGEMT